MRPDRQHKLRISELAEGVAGTKMQLTALIRDRRLLQSSVTIDGDHIEESQLSATVPTRLLLLAEGIGSLRAVLGHSDSNFQPTRVG